MDRNRYQRGGNAGNKGVEFQVNLLTVFLLNAFRRQLDNWRLSTENMRAGKLDDVVLEWAEGDILLQAKCKDSMSKKITMESLMSANPKGEFSLPKYFLSYQEIKSKFSIKHIIVCTNVGAHHKVMKYLEGECICPRSMLYYNDNSYRLYTFKADILPDLKENARIYLQKNLKDHQTLDESVITDENLQDFLRHLQFYVSYPSGYDLENSFQQMLTDMNLGCTISFSDVYVRLLNYFKHKEDEFITETYTNVIFSEICRDSHWKMLDKYNVHFERNDFDFRQHTKKILHVTAGDGVFLQELKIHRALQSPKNYVLYVNSADDVKVQQYAVEAFSLPKYTFLIIVPSSTGVTEQIYGRLKSILDKYTYKKMIIVGEKDTAFFKEINGDGDSHETIDGTVRFKDLTTDTRQRILRNKNINFQGKFVGLEELLGTQGSDYCAEVLDTAILEKLIRNENICVGQKVKNVLPYYINRTLLKNINENQSVKIFEENIYTDVKDKMVLITDSAGMGKTTILVKLATVIKQQIPTLWVIRIELIHHTAYFKELLANGKQISVPELLNSRSATKITNQLENVVFTLHDKVVLMLDGIDEISPDYTDLVVDLLVQCRKMPNFAKVIATARPHMTKLLETKLEVNSYTLQPFTEQNQIHFLTDYWSFNLGLEETDKEKCQLYAKVLISKVDEDAVFTAIPLQVRMMAEIFQQNNRLGEPEVWVGCKEYLGADDAHPKLQTKLNITKLYELFIEKKRDVFIEKNNPTGNPTSNQVLIDKFNESLVYHRILALNIFLISYDAQFFKSHGVVLEDLEGIMLQIGIVQKFDNELHFLHRTFAEYFVAQSIVQELQLPNENRQFQSFVIDEVLMERRFTVIRAFLNYFLQNVVHSLPSNIFDEYKSGEYKSHWMEWNHFQLIHSLAEEGYPALLHLILKCADFKIVKNREVNMFELYEADTAEGIPMHILGNTLRALQFLFHEGGINIRNEREDTPLDCAIENDHLETVEFLLDQGANILGKKWNTPLHCAVRNGNIEMIKLLVDRGDWDGNSGEWTVLKLSVEEKSKHVTNYFLDRILEKEGVDGKEPMFAYAAANLGRLDILKDLVARGLDVNSKIYDSEFLIFGAVQGQQLDVIKFLVETGADINGKDKFSETGQLHLCIREKSFVRTIKLLVSLGIDPTIRDWKNRTLLHIAATHGPLDLVEVLVEHGAEINSKDDDGRTALSVAASAGNLDIIKFLVEHGGDINTRDRKGNSVLHLSVCSDDLDIINFFMSHGMDLNLQNNYGQNVLYAAVVNNYIRRVIDLVELGANAHMRDHEGKTALHLNGLTRSMIDLLIELGLDVNVTDHFGHTPLHLACKFLHLPSITAFLQCGSKVDSRDNSGRTPLFYTIDSMIENLSNIHNYNRNFFYSRMFTDLDILRRLIGRQADVNAQDNNARTVLHEIASKGQLYLANYLIQDFHVVVNVRDVEGRTPLHLAAEKGFGVANFLVKQGADVNIKDCNGCTAADLARKNGHLHLLAHLKAEGTDMVEETKKEVPEKTRSGRILCCLKCL